MSLTLDLDYTGYEKYFVERRYPVWIDAYPDSAVVQYLFRFENDYGAAVYKNEETIGGYLDLWEVCAIQWVGENMYSSLDFRDGYFDDKKVLLRMNSIRRLPHRLTFDEPKFA